MDFLLGVVIFDPQQVVDIPDWDAEAGQVGKDVQRDVARLAVVAGLALQQRVGRFGSRVHFWDSKRKEPSP